MLIPKYPSRFQRKKNFNGSTTLSLSANYRPEDLEELLKESSSDSKMSEKVAAYVPARLEETMFLPPLVHLPKYPSRFQRKKNFNGPTMLSLSANYIPEDLEELLKESSSDSKMSEKVVAYVEEPTGLEETTGEDLKLVRKKFDKHL